MIVRRFSLLAIATAASLAWALSAADAATRVQKTFGQWRVDCTETEKTKLCGLIFALLNSKTKQVLFAWSIVPAKEGGNKAVIRTPNGILLAEGVSVRFAEGDPVKLAYRTCGPRSCLAEVTMSESWLKALNSHASFTVNYTAANGTPMKHDVSLQQFKEAYDFYQAQLEQKTSQ